VFTDWFLWIETTRAAYPNPGVLRNQGQFCLFEGPAPPKIHRTSNNLLVSVASTALYFSVLNSPSTNLRYPGFGLWKNIAFASRHLRETTTYC
jgi:hypothetical protein